MAAGVLDVYEVAAIYRTRDQNQVNVSHWVVNATTGSGKTDVEIANGFLAALAAVMTSFTQLCFLRGTKVSKVAPLPATAQAVSTDDGTFGSVSDDPLPSQVAGVISLRSSLAGPAGRGRKYIPGGGESSNSTTGQPSAPFTTALGALATFYSSAFTISGGGSSVGFSPVIYHRAALTWNPVTQALVRSEWGTQRRRSQINRVDAFLN